LFFGQQFLDELVVCVLQFLVHTGHYSDIVVVNQVDFLPVELFWQRTSFIGKEKVGDRLGLKRQLCS
jgi:hypothetical protein